MNAQQPPYPPQHGQPPYGHGQPPQHPPYGQPPVASTPGPRRRRKWPWILGAAIALLVSISVANGGGPGDTPTIAGAKVPDVPAKAVAGQPAQQSPVAAPEPPPTPIVHEGRGDDVVTLQKPAGVAVLDFECTRCSANTIVKTDGPEALLVNTIGNYKGRHLIDATETARTTTLEITAKGSWKVTVTPGLSALRRSAGEPISGKGDDVVLIAGSTSKALITNRGEANFIVKVAGEYMTDLAINEIGSYEGTVRLNAPAVVMVTSSGDWSITPS